MAKTFRHGDSTQRRDHDKRRQARDLARELEQWQRWQADQSPDVLADVLHVAGLAPRNRRDSWRD